MRLPLYNTGYKYFYNNNVCFVTSAKIGSRFFDNLLKLEVDKFSYPLNLSFNKFDNDIQTIPQDELSYHEYIHSNILSNSKEVIFLVRNPYNRFISGASTILDIIHNRLIIQRQSISNADFMKAFITNPTDSKQIFMSEVLEFRLNLKKFIDNGNEEILKQIIYNHIIKEAVYTDNHVSFHHFQILKFMEKTKDSGLVVKFLDIADLDTYIKCKTIDEINQDFSNKNSIEISSIFYQPIKDNLKKWIAENEYMRLYFFLEEESYHKIKREYEVLL
jgi:hypothetical protein